MIDLEKGMGLNVSGCGDTILNVQLIMKNNLIKEFKNHTELLKFLRREKLKKLYEK